MELKARPRSRSRHSTSLKSSVYMGDRIDEQIDDNESEQTLNVRVKDRENDGSKRNRIGLLFKEPTGGALKGLFGKEQLKGISKRPISSLFRRSSSRDMRSTDELVNEIIPSGLNQTRIFNSNEKKEIIKTSLENLNNISQFYHFDPATVNSLFHSQMDNIDLSLLSRYICPEDEVKEEEVSWTLDHLFASFSSEMREEWSMDDEQYDEQLCENGNQGS